MKSSKIHRKQVNASLAQAGAHKPARSHRIIPTFAQGATKVFHVGTCDRPIGETQVKRGRLRRKTTESVPCGGRMVARLGRGSRRRVYCESCRERKRQAQKVRRFQRRATRLGFLTPREEARQSSRQAFLSKLRRSGSR